LRPATGAVCSEQEPDEKVCPLTQARRLNRPTARCKMRRRFGLLLVLLCAAGCPGSPTPLPPSGPPPSLSLANFEKIHKGMTLQEVEAILGPRTAWTAADVKRPDGSVVKDVESASWFWVRVIGQRDSQQRGLQPGRPAPCQRQRGRVGEGMNWPPCRRASSQLNSAVRTPPMCR
jgi:hypothetical protein